MSHSYPSSPDSGKEKKRRIIKDWTEQILKFAEFRAIVSQHLSFKDKFECLKCSKGGNLTYSSFEKSSVIGHFDSNRHRDIVKNNDLVDSLIAKLEQIKYGIAADKEADNDSATLHSTEISKNEGKEEFDGHGDARLKLTLCKFIVDHQLPYSISQDLLLLLKEMNRDHSQSVIENCHLDRNKASEIIRDFICPKLRQEIIKQLELSVFSISVDESTDLHGQSYLAVAANYLPHVKKDDGKLIFKEPTTSLVSVIELSDSHNGQALYDKLLEEFFSLSPLLVKNCIGISCDEGRNISGKNKGVAGRLSKDFPYMVRVNDWAHKLNLITKAALNAFPSNATNIVQKISTHFSYSSIRKAKLAKIQTKLNREKILEVLSFTQVRWLSYSHCLERIIELWEPLVSYFEKYGDEQEKELVAPHNELTLRLLLLLLSKLIYYNKKFQTSYLYYKDILKYLKQSFLVFAQLLLKEEKKQMSFDELFVIDWSDKISEWMQEHICSPSEFMESFIKDFSSIQDLVRIVDSDMKQKIFNSCQDFILETISTMQEKYNIQEPIIKASKAVFLTEPQFDKNDWIVLAHQFTNVIPIQEQHLLLGETERFKIDYLQHKEDSKQKNPAAFWNTCHEDFPEMTRLAKAVLVLPQSSVSVERVFSQLKNFKNEKRNRLNTENLQASLLLFQKYGGDESSFEVTEALVSEYKKFSRDPEKKVVKNLKNQVVSPQRPIEEEKKIDINQNIPEGQVSVASDSQDLLSLLNDANLTQKLSLFMNQALTKILLNSVQNNSELTLSNHGPPLNNEELQPMQIEEPKSETKASKPDVDKCYPQDTQYKKKNESKKRISDQPLDNKEFNQIMSKKTAQGKAGGQKNSSKSE